MRHLLLLLPVAVLLPACRVSRGIHVEKFAPEPLTAQRFSGTAAATTFFTAVVNGLRPNPDGKHKGRATCYWRLQLGAETVRGANGLLNDAFKAADRDQSGTVTRAEAETFAKEWKGDDE